MQTLHRSRDRLVGERTALINQLRAILLERGLVVPQGKRKLEQYLIALMDEHDGRGLSPRIRVLVADMRTQWRELDRRIAAFDAEFVSWARENEDARRLASIPGVGVMIATALIAAIGRAESFARGRDLAAWLGLVPRQIDHRRQATPAGDQQTRQQVSSQAADPWRASGAAPPGRAGYAARSLGARDCLAAPIRTSPSWRSPTSWRGSPGRCCDAENRLPPTGRPRRHSCRLLGAQRRAERPAIGCERWKARWPDSRPASWKPGSKNGALDAVSFMRTGTRGSPSWPGFCPQAGYVDAD